MGAYKIEFAAIIIGIGVEIIFLVLGVWLMSIPMWVAIVGLFTGGALILLGLLWMLWFRDDTKTEQPGPIIEGNRGFVVTGNENIIAGKITIDPEGRVHTGDPIQPANPDAPGGQQVSADGDVTQVRTGDIHIGDINNITVNITPEALEKIMSEQQPQQPNIHVESHGQQGGITAGIVNIQADLQPKIELSEVTHNEVANGHQYEAILTVDTHYTVPQIRITAHAPSIQSLDVAPQRSGMHMFGHTGKREGYHFTTIQNAAGKYRIRVTTAEPEEVAIDLE